MDPDIVFERRAIVIMITGALMAYMLVFASFMQTLPFWIIYRGMFVADTMFHELGHTVFSWTFGRPAIPSIFTLFGSEQAGGVTLAFDRSWFMQGVSFAGLAYGCYWVKCNYPSLLWGAAAAMLAIIGIAFTRYYSIPILYMGHGGSIFMGGFFLFRAWRYTDARTYTRWMNAFFGFFLVFNNMRFAYKLATDAVFREDYETPTFGGAIDNDFVQMTELVWRWSLQGIAVFTVAYCMLALVVPIFLAWYLKEEDVL